MRTSTLSGCQIPVQRRSLAAAIVAAILAPSLDAQTSPDILKRGRLLPASCSRIADPKLDGGGVNISFFLKPVQQTARVVVEVVSKTAVVATVFDQYIRGSAQPIELWWNGLDDAGLFVDPGDYVVRVSSPTISPPPVTYPISIVRLGITEIEARPNAGNDEWQMVYFRKGSKYQFFATPAIHEYLSVKDTGDIADMDLNDGSPRPAVPVHTETDEPVMEGTYYDDDGYNYPVCYLAGTQPVLELTFGSTGTSSSGTMVPASYPVPGHEIRAVGEDLSGGWTTATTSITPGGAAEFTGPALPALSTRTDVTVTWTWQYREIGSADWEDIHGSFATDHRFYTLIGQPHFASGATGTQYAGPWVEVVQYLCTWKDALGIVVNDQASANEAIILGTFGQQGSLPRGLEGVVYDCYSTGGDSGASHYWDLTSINLSALLNSHAKGRYVNCDDCSGFSSVMLAMVGVKNVKRLYLGTMYLRAVWGLGCDDYTLNIFGFYHGFGHHRIVTRFDGAFVSDVCMCVDDDSDPDRLPGTPGYNSDRPWNGPSGYNTLAATNDVTKSLEPLPKIK